MSHVAKIQIQVLDLESLKKVAKELGLVFMENQRTYKWYGTSVGDYPLPEGFTRDDLGKCDHALRIADGGQFHKGYEIGVCKAKSGKGYQLLWDFWNGGYGLTDRVGTKGEKLIQGYAVEVARKTALKQGFRIMGQTVRADGKIELTVQR